MKKDIKKSLSLGDLASKLPALIDKLAAAEKDIAQQMAVLKKQGLIYAKPHWRNGKYLYLLHPTKAGEKRIREYVGSESDKIEAAEAAMLRATQYTELEKRLQKLQNVASEGRKDLVDAIETFTRW
jgi:hypothetical protein